MGLLLVMWAGRMCGQVEAQFSQSDAAIGYYNPASVGLGEDMQVRALFKIMDRKDIRPYYSGFVSGDMPLTLEKTRHGVGALFFYDRQRAYQAQLLALPYNYQLTIRGGKLAIGVQPGVIRQQLDGRKLQCPMPDNPQTGVGEDAPTLWPQESVNKSALALNAGLFYTQKHLSLGIAIQHITEPEVRLSEEYTAKRLRTFNFSAAYNIPAKNSLFEWEPSVFIWKNAQAFSADITGRVIYDNRFRGGLTYRLSDATGRTTNTLVGLLGMQWGKVHIGYAFDYSLSGGRHHHELVARLYIELPKTQTKRASYKSVRLL